ncbi:MAG: hypothetical protein ACKPCP_27315 [Sphaerospermopsis kisseleviana]
MIHKQRLIEECPHCGSRLPVMARFSPARFCSRCYGWLGQEIKGEEDLGLIFRSWVRFCLGILGWN